MGCDYYIQTELVIEYQDRLGRLSFIYTDREIKERYIFQYSNYDSDDDDETMYQKYKVELEKQIAKNTYNKILFDNDNWVEDSYKKNYEDRIRRDFEQVNNIKKIYKKFTSWKRN